MVTTSADLLEVLRKSEVLQASQLDAFLQLHGDERDPRQLARKLVDAELVTEWQARFFLSGRHRIKIGQYVLLDRFQKHELGDRFLAVHQQLGRKVDIQIFPERLAKNEELFAAFLKQASQVAKLDHPNLVHLYDIDREAERYYFVFEHEEGRTLDKIPIGSLSAKEIASIVHQALDGLEFAHKHQILHGRLNESQVRISPNGKVRIRNIGLAELMKQLREASQQPDDYAIEHEPVDDLITVGVIGRKLMHQHVGHAKTESERKLVALLTNLSKALPGHSVTPTQINAEIKSWIAGSGRDTELAERKAKEVGDDTKRLAGNNRVFLAIAASVVLIGVLAGGVMIFGGGGNSSVAKRPVDNDSADTDQKGGTKANPGDSKISDAINEMTAKTDGAAAEDTATPPDPPPVEDVAENANAVDPGSTAEVSVPPDTAQDAADTTDPADVTPIEPKPLLPPFEGFPNAVDLPVVIEGSAPADIILANVHAGPNDMLGIELISGDAIAPGGAKLVFQLARADRGETQVWEVQLTKRSQDAPSIVGQFSYENEELRFQWMDEATGQTEVNYLRNCALRLMARGQTRLLPLRQPVAAAPLVVSLKNPRGSSKTELDWLPDRGALVVEIVELSKDDLPVQVFEPVDRCLGEQSQVGYLYLTEDPKCRFVHVAFSTTFKNDSIQVDAQIEMLGKENRFIRFHERGYSDFGTALKIDTAGVKTELFTQQQIVAPDGQKQKHAAYVKSLSELLNVRNSQVVEYDASLPLVERLFDRNFDFRIYYTLNEIRIELVTPTTGQKNLAQK